MSQSDASTLPLANPRSLLLLVVAMICIPLGLILLFLAITGGERNGQAALTPQTLSANFDPSATGLAGRWNVLGGQDSWVGYSVNEQLGKIPVTHTAEGKSDFVEGGFVLTPDSITAVAVNADLSSLKSDDAKRDEAMKTSGLETNAFPRASFYSSSTIPLSRLPKPGEDQAFTVPGLLQIHGVTKAVELKLQARILNQAPLAIDVVGNYLVTFSDFGIVPPNVAGVSLVEDHAILQIHLRLARVPDEVATNSVPKPNGSTPGSTLGSTPGSRPASKQ